LFLAAGYVLIGAVLALVWLPPQPWRPVVASTSADEFFAVFGGPAAPGARIVRRVLAVLLVVLLWPLYWRARCASRRRGREGGSA
jgi:hypothetical protein